MAQFLNMGIANVQNTFKNLPSIGSDGKVNGPNAKPLNYNLIELRLKAGALADGVNPIVNIKAGTSFNKSYSVNRIIGNPGTSFNNLVKGSLANLTDADLQGLYNLEGSGDPGIKFLFNPTNSAVADEMWTTPKDASFEAPQWIAPSIVAIIPIKTIPIGFPSIEDELEIEVGTFTGGTGPTTPPTTGTNAGVSIGKDRDTIGEETFHPIEFVIGGTKVITTTTTCTNGEGKVTTIVREKRVPVAGDCLNAMVAV